MADILFVCVRKDAPLADALAQRFEAAGFSIGGLAATEALPDSSAAGVLIWSHAARQSLPFRETAHRVVRAGKAVFASLIDIPSPAIFGCSPTFDLSRWNGDADDPALDSLCWAAERKLTHHLCEQAVRWRAIRESRTASDFADYIARYGPDGAFSSLAELRMKQFVGDGVRPERASSATTLRPATPASSERIHARFERADPRESDRRECASTRQASIFAEGESTAPQGPGAPASGRAEGGSGRSNPQPAGPGDPNVRRAAMTVPFIVGAALAGVLYFGGVGESVVPAAEGIRVAGAGASGVIYLDESVGPENGLPPVSQPRATTGSIERISAPVAAARRPADRLIGAMDAPESSESLTPPPSEPGRHPMDAVAQIAPAAVSTEATFLEPDPPGADAAHDSQPADVADAPLGTIKAGESTQFEAAATLEWLLQGDDERGFVGPEQ